MLFPLKFSGAGFWLSLLLLGCGKKAELVPQAPTPAPAITSLTLESLTPAAGALVSRTSTITAQLTYSLAANETSSEGYEEAIQFATPNSSTTLANDPSTVTLPDRKGTVTLQYPLRLIWDSTNPAVAHPITCSFYLLRLNSATSSRVIAQTPAQKFTE